MEPGTRVRMSPQHKQHLITNGSAEHVAEFGDCEGTVEGLVRWNETTQGPEVDVRWLPSGLRYAYHPNDLEVVESPDKP